MNILTYWTLKKWYWNHYLMKGAKYLYSTLVPVAQATWRWFPIVDFFWYNYMLFWEVYEVSNQKQLKRIDSLEGHPDWYKRVMVKDFYGNEVEAYHQDVSGSDLSGFTLFDLPGLPKCISWWSIKPERIRAFKNNYKNNYFLVQDNRNSYSNVYAKNVTCWDYTGNIVYTKWYVSQHNKCDTHKRVNYSVIDWKQQPIHRHYDLVFSK